MANADNRACRLADFADAGVEHFVLVPIIRTFADFLPTSRHTRGRLCRNYVLPRRQSGFYRALPNVPPPGSQLLSARHL
jgi:hypothetical protein